MTAYDIKNKRERGGKEEKIRERERERERETEERERENMGGVLHSYLL